MNVLITTLIFPSLGTNTFGLTPPQPRVCHLFHCDSGNVFPNWAVNTGSRPQPSRTPTAAFLWRAPPKPGTENRQTFQKPNYPDVTVKLGSWPNFWCMLVFRIFSTRISTSDRFRGPGLILLCLWNEPMSVINMLKAVQPPPYEGISPQPPEEEEVLSPSQRGIGTGANLRAGGI